MNFKEATLQVEKINDFINSVRFVDIIIIYTNGKTEVIRIVNPTALDIWRFKKLIEFCTNVKEVRF